jgi:hypothetical protein
MRVEGGLASGILYGILHMILVDLLAEGILAMRKLSKL